MDIYNVPAAKQRFVKKLAASGPLSLDLSQLSKLDTAGALLLVELQQQYALTWQNIDPKHQVLLDMVSKQEITPLAIPAGEFFGTQLVKQIGIQTIAAFYWLRDFLIFLGQACVNFHASLFSPKHFRFNEIMYHIEEAGIKAVPIISAMAFMIAIVLSYQGVAQLRPLGAQHLSVNLVAISVLREMGVLLTAIMVAGRSGSAFAAEIGVMKLRDEVDALRVTGIDPFEMLTMPRLIALIIVLPLLTFIADMMGLLGGGIMSMLLIDLPMGSYIARVKEVTNGNDFLVGMIKAPVFAFLIAMVGCIHGMKVSGSAESVGHETTASVVKAIFLVLVADAMFSILFERLGI